MDNEHETSQDAYLTDDQQAQYRSMLEQKASEILPEFSAEMDLPDDMTFGELGDMIRGASERCPVADYANYLREIAGWAPTLVTDKGVASPGDYLFSLQPAEGVEPVPAIFFPAHTVPFDQTDPLLDYYTAKYSASFPIFMLMMPMASFKFTHSATGTITRIVLHGGWLVENGIRTPFVISPKGSGTAKAQAQYFCSDDISRGFYRDHGLDGNHIGAIGKWTIKLAQSKDATMTDQLQSLLESAGMTGKAAASLEDLSVATGRGDWSMLVDQRMQQLITSLASTL
jgi:hypothetical protein